MEKLIIAGKKINTKSIHLVNSPSLKEIQDLDIFSNLPQKERTKAEKEVYSFFNKTKKNATEELGKEDTSS